MVEEKAPAKKAPAKKVEEKAPAKKAPVKKVEKEVAPAKKAPAKKVEKEVAPVKIAPVEEVKPVVEEKAPVKKEAAKKSSAKKVAFSEAMAETTDKLKGLYNDIKNELMAYEDVKSTIGSKGETFKFNGEVIAKIIFDEKVIVGFAVDAAKAKKYSLSEISDDKTLSDASVSFVVKSQAAVKECTDVLEDIIAVEHNLIKKAKKKVVDFASKF